MTEAIRVDAGFLGRSRLFIVFVEISACAQLIRVAHSPVQGPSIRTYRLVIKMGDDGESPCRLPEDAYFGGCGGFGMADSIRIFHFPPSRTSVDVQMPAISIGAPV